MIMNIENCCNVLNLNTSFENARDEVHVATKALKETGRHDILFGLDVQDISNCIANKVAVRTRIRHETHWLLICISKGDTTKQHTHGGGHQLCNDAGEF